MLLVDALEGLAALHSWRIIHQDIKPENILIDSDGRALIADLGVSATRGKPLSIREVLRGRLSLCLGAAAAPAARNGTVERFVCGWTD